MPAKKFNTLISGGDSIAYNNGMWGRARIRMGGRTCQIKSTHQGLAIGATAGHIRGLRRDAAAVVAVLALTFAMTFAVGSLGLRTPWNLAWMLGIPAAVTVLFYRRSPILFPVLVGLVLCSFSAANLAAEAIGFG